MNRRLAEGKAQSEKLIVSFGSERKLAPTRGPSGFLTSEGVPDSGSRRASTGTTVERISVDSDERSSGFSNESATGRQRSAEEIEHRYDHSRHPSAIVEAEELAREAT